MLLKAFNSARKLSLFSQVSVCPRGEGVFAPLHAEIHTPLPWDQRQTSPWADTPPPWADSPFRSACWDKVQQVGSTHATGMHSCCLINWYLQTRRANMTRRHLQLASV